MYKLSNNILQSLDIAKSKALELKHSTLEWQHLAYGLYKNPQTIASIILKSFRSDIEKQLSNLPTLSHPLNSIDSISYGSSFSTWLVSANALTIEKEQEEIEEEELLSILPRFLPNYQFNLNDIKEIKKKKKNFFKLKTNSSNNHQPQGASGVNGNGDNNEDEEWEVPFFLINLNELATQGKLDPVIGRSKEIRSVIEILGRRNKNNPVLVGSAGVGKTAIVEGLAWQITRGNVPDILKNKSIYSLDLGALLAGSQYRGDFEKRIQTLTAFVKHHKESVILFIDEIHQLVGAGKTEGAMDAANLLKPSLARGDLNCIGATTFNEYQKYILNDSALDRRFRSVTVSEPTVEDSIEILLGIRDKLEIHHGIKISDQAIYSAAILSQQYITDKNLPDKAIDLIDEAASSLKLSVETLPAHLEEMQSQIRAKKIYAQVDKEDEVIIREIQELETDFQEKKHKWDEEILSLKKVSSLKNQLDHYQFELEKQELKQNYEEASKIKYSILPNLKKELEKSSHNFILQESHIAQIISLRTQIPFDKIMQNKQDTILALKDHLKSEIFGQDEAINDIVDTLMLSYAGLSEKNRPLGSFFLQGPSGVGKTQTVKEIAKFLLHGEKNIVRLDMSEYSEKHSVAKLIGAPHGYVGHEDGGILTEAIRRNPYSIILFDEIEKSHPDLADILLQILDDGHLTDNKGRRINFKNTMIFLTSNTLDITMDFRPELIGRLDAIINFKSLNTNLIDKLIEKELLKLNTRLKGKHVTITISEQIVQELRHNGLSAEYGARPFHALFNKLVTRPLAKKIIEGYDFPDQYMVSDLSA